MFTKQFWLDAVERAGKTLAQNLMAPLVVSGIGSATHQHWLTILQTAAVAAVLSLATSVGSLPVNGNGNASLIRDVRPGRHEVPSTAEVTP